MDYYNVKKSSFFDFSQFGRINGFFLKPIPKWESKFTKSLILIKALKKYFFVHKEICNLNTSFKTSVISYEIDLSYDQSLWQTTDGNLS